MLDGYKTYISVVIGLILALLFGLGVMDHNTFMLLLTIIGFSSVAALRDALKKMIAGN
jgi:hypothetical protein